MKKEMWLVVALAAVIIILLGVFVFLPTKKTPQQNPPVTTSGIEITSPKANEVVSSPLKITGVVNGSGWSGFEGQVGSVVLTFKSSDSLEIVNIDSVPLVATTEWTKLPTNFEATIDLGRLTFSDDYKAFLTFRNENPSGDPAKDKTFVLPVTIK